MNLIESYRVVYNFLDTYYWKNKSDELCSLVSSMPLLSDNSSADAASMIDWKFAVCQTIGTQEDIDLSSEMVYNSMIAYLRNWAAIGTDGTIEKLWMEFDKSNCETNEWKNVWKNVSNSDDGPYFHLEY